jgi:hypothetical protein
MNFPQHQDYPPPDFVAFLAQRSGLSQEAAEHRLENWFGEYHQTANGRAQRATQVAPRSY